jgi:hypothetical protein
MLAERMTAEDALTAEVARLTALLQAAQGETGEQLSALQRENEQLQSQAASVRTYVCVCVCVCVSLHSRRA